MYYQYITSPSVGPPYAKFDKRLNICKILGEVIFKPREKNLISLVI